MQFPGSGGWSAAPPSAQVEDGELPFGLRPSYFSSSQHSAPPLYHTAQRLTHPACTHRLPCTAPARALRLVAQLRYDLSLLNNYRAPVSMLGFHHIVRVPP